MVRRLRDKHRAGESLVTEGDVEKLSAILSRGACRRSCRQRRTVGAAIRRPRSGGTMGERIERIVRASGTLFQDQSVGVTDERVVRYLVTELHKGRHFDDILADPYYHPHRCPGSRTTAGEPATSLQRDRGADLRGVRRTTNAESGLGRRHGCLPQVRLREPGRRQFLHSLRQSAGPGHLRDYRSHTRPTGRRAEVDCRRPEAPPVALLLIRAGGGREGEVVRPRRRSSHHRPQSGEPSVP